MKVLPLLCAVAGAWTQAPASGAEPTAEQILTELTAQRDAWENAVIESSWEELYDGILTSWEDQRFTWDNLGRRRVAYENGQYDQSGARAKRPASQAATSDTVFDGELVAFQQYFPERDRVGEALKEPSPAAGYRTAIISDAQAPVRRDLESHRNPMEYLRKIVIRELDRAIRDKRVVSVKPVEPGQPVYRVEWTEPKEADHSWRRTAAVVDPSRGWTILGLQSSADNDRIVRTIDYEYSLLPTGIWAPARGSHKHWGDQANSTAPAFEWRFTVKRCEVNDPELGDAAFAMNLPSDAAVSDTRFGVSYRVGAVGAMKADLDRLAEEARAEAQTQGGPRAADSPPSRWRWLWIAVNTVLILAIVAYLARTQWRRRAAPTTTHPRS